MNGTTSPLGAARDLGVVGDPAQEVTAGITVRRFRYEDAGEQRPLTSVPVPVPVRWTVSPQRRRSLTRLVVVLLEVLDTRRPLAGVTAMVAPPVARYLRASRMLQRAGTSRVLSTRIDVPRPGVAEVAAVCRIGGQVRAVALRVERGDDGGGWIATVLRVL